MERDNWRVAAALRMASVSASYVMCDEVLASGASLAIHP